MNGWSKAYKKNLSNKLLILRQVHHFPEKSVEFTLCFQKTEEAGSWSEAIPRIELRAMDLHLRYKQLRAETLQIRIHQIFVRNLRVLLE